MRVNVVGLMYSPAPYKRIAHAYVNWATRGRRVLKRLPFGACGGFDNNQLHYWLMLLWRQPWSLIIVKSWINRAIIYNLSSILNNFIVI